MYGPKISQHMQHNNTKDTISILFLTLRNLRAVVPEIKNSIGWRSAVARYGMNCAIFFPDDYIKLDEFLRINSVWCFDYEAHFSLMIEFDNDIYATLFWYTIQDFFQ
ncbi:MAG: hypothetical protein HC836_23030 [Richelia sp. RM2_1_2]|nr:hypothetical protein [Richelia sp. RM2_1_2]